MKIAFVHPALMDYRMELFNKLHKTLDTTFIFTKQGRGQDDVKEKHPEIPLEWKYKIVRNDRFAVRKREILTDLKLARELMNSRYDIILTSTSWYVCFLIARITGKKFILWTESWYSSSSSLKGRFRALITRFIARHADAVIASGTKPYEVHLDFGVKDEKIFKCIQCSPDFSKLPTNDLRDEFDLKEKRIILYFGRIVQSKGLDYLIKVFAMLKQEKAALLIAGDGPFRKECENMAKELGVKNIFFTGWVNEMKASYYKVCDIFVLPAIYEPWGLVINEAMAFSKPIVTTDGVGAAYDLVKDGYNGYVVEKKNIQELYKAILNILSNSEVAEEMGMKSRKIFEDKNDYGHFLKAFDNAINFVSES